MNVYFVRHAQSLLTEKMHQLPDTPLSNLGIQQAENIARRLTHVPVELILSSSYLRAIQTSQEINKTKMIPIISSDILVERKMPSNFLGKNVDDKEIITAHHTIRKHFYDADWHYADEENFRDLIERASNALEFILSHQKENIVVVTHGYFLTILIFYILFSENIPAKMFSLFRSHTEFSLTGLTLVEYKNKKWKVITLNDYDHLR